MVIKIIIGVIARLFLAALLSLPFDGLGRATSSSIGGWLFIGLLVFWPFQTRILRKVLPPQWHARFKLTPPPSIPVYPTYPYNPTNYGTPPYPPINNAPPPGYNYGPPSGPNPYGNNYPPAPGPNPYGYNAPPPPYAGGYPAAQPGPAKGYTPPAPGPSHRYGQPIPGYGATPAANNRYGQPISGYGQNPPPAAPYQNQAAPPAPAPASPPRPAAAPTPAQAESRPPAASPKAPNPAPAPTPPPAASSTPESEASTVIVMPPLKTASHREIRQKRVKAELDHLQIGKGLLACLEEIGRLKYYLENRQQLEWDRDLLAQYEAWAKSTGLKLQQAGEAIAQLVQAESLTDDVGVQDYIVEANLTPGNQQGRLLDEMPLAFEQLAATLVRANAILHSGPTSPARPKATIMTALREMLTELEVSSSKFKVQS